jgi:transposase
MPSLPDSDPWPNYLEHFQARVLNVLSDRDRWRSGFAKRDAEIAERDAEIAELRRHIDEFKADSATDRAKAAFAFHELQQKLFELQAEISKRDKIIENLNVKLGDPAATSDNSGLPPSADFNKKSNSSDSDGDDKNKKKGDDKKEKKEKKAKGKPGPKKGHKPHTRKPAPKEEVDRFEIYDPESTTCECGCEMVRCEEEDVRYQQYELPPKLLVLTESVGAGYKCPKCGKVHKGTVPEDKQSLLAPLLLAFIVNLKVVGRVSFRNIQQCLLDTMGFEICLGCLSKVLTGTSRALKSAYEEIKEAIKGQPVLNVDETTHKENGKRLYTWIFSSPLFVFFVIGDRTRTILDTILGIDWKGVLCCDYYSVYLSFAKKAAGVRLQHCLAHIKREFKRCAEHSLDLDIMAYGQKMLRLLEALFKAKDEYKNDQNQETYEKLRRSADEFCAEAKIAPPKGRPKSLAKRFQGKENTYTTFVDTPGVEPTNNSAERGIRPVVMTRNVTQGTRSKKGRDASEKYWTVRGTCELQGRSFYRFLLDSYNAYRKKEKPPSILPQ